MVAFEVYVNPISRDALSSPSRRLLSDTSAYSKRQMKKIARATTATVTNDTIV